MPAPRYYPGIHPLDRQMVLAPSVAREEATTKVVGFAEAGCEVEDGCVGDRDSCEPHHSDRTHVRVLAKGWSPPVEPDGGSEQMCCKRYKRCVVDADDGGEAAS